jgi:putative spermidine/putrescine transport system ATP-binding protein
MTTAVSFEGVSKHFDAVVAVDDVSLAIEDGEFFSMLGPSGSGKTTCLRMIAGFEQPSAGRILLHGEDVTLKPPYERDVNTVFQDYALFPHMSVAENVAYSLMVKRVPEGERRARVEEALGLVQLGGFQSRKPRQLSGGQRQRVALARALINRPSVLLLDEPLGALDLKLRQAMQVELKGLQRTIGITFIFVTHDQEEALTMSDRIAVFNHGRVEQVGTPAGVYERPTNAFVAGFVGTSNVLDGQLAIALHGSPEPFTVRPEKIHLASPDSPVDPGACTVTGSVRDVVYLGASTRYRVELDLGGELVVMQQNLKTSSMEALQVKGRRVRLIWDPEFNQTVHESSESSEPEEEEE